MASVYESARSASKSRRGRSGGILLSTLLACGVIAGSAWAVVSTLGAMQEAATSLKDGRKSVSASLHVKSTVGTETTLGERRVKVAKFSRLSQPSQSEVRQKQLTAEAIQIAHQRKISIQLASAVKREKAKAAMIEAAFARAERSVEQEKALTGQPAMVTALVEDVSARKDIQPFGLVMAKPEKAEEDNILSQIPLPEAKPALETVVVEQKPVEEKPVARNKRETREKVKQEIAYAKPDRSLFGDLFKSKDSGTGWPGKGTRVAIYDVSSATVYMPDGTKLRAHSGIGKMRDNPRYEHVKMNGPTPAGIYRLKMRERRFHGVEAIRMTSIDGRDPKNRTGLLTHTNLLRGQKGSHGCVAFQNYEPFLKAFKRGHITMMVVVPELPSSRTQLAALYRKAGA